ncbi:MAG: ABC transporter permease [Spirochaetes bacterium]|nr:ABC transporter permease [Spirochaetota bacterium]
MSLLLNIFTPALAAATLGMATPLIFGSISGTFSERTGVINLGIEGMMLMGAFGAGMATLITGNPWIGVLFGGLLGAFMGLIHAVMCIKFRANQSVVGVGINIMAAGIPAIILQFYWGNPGRTPMLESIENISVPLLSRIPVLGDMIGKLNPLTYLALLLVLVSHVIIFKTPFGLRMRAVGHHPKAVDTVGVNVFRIRYICVITSGFLAGIGGSYLAVAQLSMFVNGMTAGRGFVALAAMIFGKWTPLGCLGAALLFGFSDALQMTLQAKGVPIPSDFLLMIPYILTMIALAGFVGKAVAPASNGKPYIKN